MVRSKFDQQIIVEVAKKALDLSTETIRGCGAVRRPRDNNVDDDANVRSTATDD
jgi:hypothetical protein